MSDTVVVCRPGQLREAATVLACFPVGPLPPLFVLEQPPCTDEQYAALYESYRSMRNVRDVDTGTIAAREKKLAIANSGAWSSEAINSRVEALSPYREWVKKNSLMTSLLQDLPLRSAIFLFEASEKDVSAIEPMPIDQLTDVRQSFLGEGVKWVKLLPEAPGGTLAERAWQLIRGSEERPAEWWEANSGNPSVIAGLFNARKVEGDPVEAVLLEAADDAAKLLAVMYALSKGASLFVIDAVDLTPVERSRQALQAWQEREMTDSENGSTLLAEMETAVSALMPPDIAEAIGHLPLTAFTTGVPWHFFKNAKYDWSTKPIGLIAGDELLICTEELFGTSSAAVASFNMVFDPGFFQTGETEGVMKQLRTSAAFPLLLQGEAASNTALILAGSAPVELIYFDTHGSGEAILLNDMPLPAYKLLQRVRLASHPLVFNNSCLSWTGVGRQFISAGARAYIGTLWSVRADEAAAYAIRVAERIAGRKEPFAASIRNTGVSALTEMAYVFVGPVSAALRAPREDHEDRDERERVLTAAGTLLEMALKLTESGPQADSPLTGPVIRALEASAQPLCEEVDRRWPEPDNQRLNLLTDQVLVAMQIRRDAGGAKYCAELCMRGLKMLDSVDTHSKADIQIRAAFLQVCARAADRMGEHREALDLLLTSAKQQEAAGQNPGAEYLEISDRFRASGEHDKAIESALRAKEAFAQPGPQSTAGRLRANGRLAQLWRDSGKLSEAAAAAKEGYEDAVEADDLGEQALFRMDQSRIHMLLGEYPEAVSCADEALNLARRQRDEDLEVSALGTLTRAMIFNKEWVRARQIANDGYRTAVRRKMPSQVGDYLVDLSDIARGEGDFKGAMEKLTEAGGYFASTANNAKIQNLLRHAGEILHTADNWESQQELLRLIVKVIRALDLKYRNSVCTGTIQSLVQRISKDGWRRSRDYLWQTRGELESACAGSGKDSEQLEFIRDFLIACHQRSKSQRDDALAIAKQLDEMSEGGFKIAELMENPRIPV